MMSSDNSAEIKWIAVDWGTSRLRVFAMDGRDHPIAEKSSDQGMGGLTPDAFEPALKALVTEWIVDSPKPLLACGMVGARQGWIEAAYAATPCPALSVDGLVRAPAADNTFALRILPGLCQMDPADVMRGEETQIAGFLSANKGFEGQLCLPGTHSKWAHLKDNQVTGFRTFMTGELFALLSGQSVLRHSVAAPATTDDASSTFLQGLERARQMNGNLSAELFSIRAKGLLHDFGSGDAFDYLSGLLIGAELVEALAADTRTIALVGSGPLGQRYQAALDAFGVTTTMMNTSDATLAGLTAAYHTLKEAGEWAAI
ncbi:2-dehydro-3-deoxygalactonokinase [Roseibium sp.]|uniref:2-dehydro-3-deoxygalactonokinase n=1 Tax=Roseibium sp. TaxID=1936156 RepID=UPI003A985FF5